jgi:amino acid efflux transporter
MIGLLLAGSVYWACTVLVLHFHAFGSDMAAAASLPNIVVRLFGVQALWIACVIGYLACFASLNIYIQSFARLVWSQAQYKPESYLARLSPQQIPRNALNVVLGCCVISTLGIYWLDINLDALIVYANGIFIMIYLLCMLAGCRLLRGAIGFWRSSGACSACCYWRWSAGKACTPCWLWRRCGCGCQSAVRQHCPPSSEMKHRIKKPDSATHIRLIIFITVSDRPCRG